LDDYVMATFTDGKLQSLNQTKRLGRTDYIWTHSAAGCHVPKLNRIQPAAPQQP
jgi:hypothetical protein